MLVYDITSAKTFDNITKWLRNIDEVMSMTETVSCVVSCYLGYTMYAESSVVKLHMHVTYIPFLWPKIKRNIAQISILSYEISVTVTETDSGIRFHTRK